MKVILKNTTVIVKDKDEENVDDYERIDIIKEDGTSFRESTGVITSTDTCHGLEWWVGDIVSLLEFLGIEYELLEDVAEETMKEEE